MGPFPVPACHQRAGARGAALQVSAANAQRRRVSGDKKVAANVTKRGMVPDAAAEVCAALPARPNLAPSERRAWRAACRGGRASYPSGRCSSASSSSSLSDQARTAPSAAEMHLRRPHRIATPLPPQPSSPARSCTADLQLCEQEQGPLLSVRAPMAPCSGIIARCRCRRGVACTAAVAAARAACALRHFCRRPPAAAVLWCTLLRSREQTVTAAAAESGRSLHAGRDESETRFQTKPAANQRLRLPTLVGQL